MKRIVFYSIFFLVSIVCFADTPEEDFKDAKQFFIAQDYSKAYSLLANLYETYRFDEETQEEVFYMLFVVDTNLGKIDSAAEMIARLYKKKPEKYGKEYGLFFYKNYSDESSIEILEKSLENGTDKETALVLGDYYFLKLNYNKACEFYRLFDSQKFVNSALLAGDFKRAEEIIPRLKPEEKDKIIKQIKDYKLQTEDKDKAKKYYEQADKNFNENKLELAKIYYLKIITELKENELKQKAYFSIGKINYLSKKYTEANTNFEKYLEYNDFKKNAEVLYYLGNCYMNLMMNDKALEYFDRLAAEYPFTVWETKAKIYRLKLKK